MLWIFFLTAIFILLQKNAFGRKNFQISCMGSKAPYWQFPTNLSKAWNAKLEAGIFWSSKNLYRRCATTASKYMPQSTSIEICPFRHHFIKFSKTVFMK